MTGAAIVGNDTNGVEIEDTADNVVGGSASGAGNVLSGNRHGVMLQGAQATGNQILGNHIGVDAAGTAALPNNWCGVRIREGAFNNTLGGITPRRSLSIQPDFGFPSQSNSTRA